MVSGVEQAQTPDMSGIIKQIEQSVQGDITKRAQQEALKWSIIFRS